MGRVGIIETLPILPVCPRLSCLLYLGRSENSKILGRLGFFRHFIGKTRPKTRLSLLFWACFPPLVLLYPLASGFDLLVLFPACVVIRESNTVEALLTDTLVSGQFYIRTPSQNPVFLNAHTTSVFLHPVSGQLQLRAPLSRP